MKPTDKSRTTHTPGPWKVGNGPVIYTEDLRVLVAEGHGLNIEDTEVDANARLIAASPDLLFIAKRIHALMESGDLNGADWTEFAQLGSAIAKAEGE